MVARFGKEAQIDGTPELSGPFDKPHLQQSQSSLNL